MMINGFDFTDHAGQEIIPRKQNFFGGVNGVSEHPYCPPLPAQAGRGDLNLKTAKRTTSPFTLSPNFVGGEGSIGDNVKMFSGINFRENWSCQMMDWPT